MNKYLSVPTYYQDLSKNNISSENLQTALNEDDLLNYLRHTYQQNISLFYNIRDELILRGLNFKKEYQNNFFPDLPYKIRNIIYIKEDNTRFQQIDTKITGIQSIINRYNVKSDLFFKNMPIEGLSHFLKRDTTFLAKQLEQAGISIIPVEEAGAAVTINPEKEQQVSEVNTIIQLDLVKSELEHEQDDNDLHNDDIRICACFLGSEYLAFHGYCLDNQKEFFSELSIDFIREFKHVKGVGVTKYTKVLNRFKEVTSERSRVVKIQSEEEKIDSAIDFFLTNPLRRILEQKDIDYLKFVDSIYSAKEEKDWFNSIQQQVFDEKKLYFQTVVEELNYEKKINEFKTLQETLKNHPYYELLMNFKKISFHRILQLPTLEEQDENIHLFEMAEDITHIRDLKIIVSSLEKYIPPSVQIENIENILSDREWNILIERLDKTLQEVGELVGVTRERVRQIERKANDKLKSNAKALHLDIYYNYFLQNKPSLSLEEFMGKLRIDINYINIFTLLVDCNESLERKEDVLINKQFYSYVNEVQNTISEHNINILEASEVLDMFNKSSEFEFTIEITDYFMKEIGYKRKNGIYSKINIKMPAQIAYLFKYKITEPLEMNDENFEYLQSLMENVFDDQFESGKRAAVARIRDTKNVILVEANTFMYQNLEDVSQELLNDIEQAIEEALENESMVTANILYIEHLEKWSKYNLLSHYHLYSILQFHFKDDYIIGKGNTLGIFKSESAKVHTESLLISYLEKNNGVLSKRQILEDLKWPSYKLEQVISKSKEMITVVEEGIEGYAVKLINSFEFRKSELLKIQKFVKDFITEDYFFTADLLFEMEFEDELSEILGRTNITDTYTFGSILKWLDPDLRGYQHLLFKKNSKIDSIEKVLIERFPNLVRRDEIEGFLEGKGYSLSTVFSVITQLLDNESFYIYTAYQFINAKQVHFTDEVKDSLKQYLQKSFGDRLYFSALDLKGYTTDILSATSNGWRPQLITEFAPLVGFKHIRTTSDYRYNKWILVREEVGITNYEELVHYVVTNEYEGTYHERELAMFLEERKLAHSPNQLSIELKTSPYFEMKDLGFVKVKEHLNGVN